MRDDMNKKRASPCCSLVANLPRRSRRAGRKFSPLSASGEKNCPPLTENPRNFLPARGERGKFSPRSRRAGKFSPRSRRAGNIFSPLAATYEVNLAILICNMTKRVLGYFIAHVHLLR